MRERARELAEEEKWKDREEYLDANPEGVPLRELGLDEDPKFLEMEERRRELLKDPVRNAGKIAALEKDMNDYVHELAKQKLADDRKNFLPSHISGVPLEDIPLDDDSLFRDMERERARLIAEDPVRNARKIQDLEKKMNARAQELAEAQKWKDREEYLDANPEGVPLRELGLDEDPKFLEMEERRRELLKDPVRNAGKIAALEKDMNDYVHELAKQKLADDRKNFLPSHISGVPLEDIPLDDDSLFRDMERERARLIAEDPVRNARKIQDLEKKMNARAQELAEAQKWKDREEYLDANPEGVPLRELGLDEDPKFLEMEERRRELLKDPVRNAGKIAALEKDMNDYVHELAKQKKADELGGIMSKDRGLASAPVDPEVLLNDPEFASLEAKWRELMKDPKKNAREIAAIEEKMRERARELAEEEKWKDREEYLDANPEGVPLRELGLDEDPKFLEMEERRRELLKDPVRNAGKIAALEKDMNDYVHELAKQKLADDRKNFLPSHISGVPLEDIPLDDDSLFRDMERERARLIAEDPVRNARKIQDLEKKMNARAQELAEAQKWKDREEYLDANPEGVPLRELGLDEDPKFLEMEERRRELLKDPVRNAGKIAALEKDMNDYVHELAKQKLADDRKNFLPSHISGVPLEDIPLDDDSLFRDMERERARLIAEDPVRNARKIQDLEKKMNARAQELAEAQKWKDREEYLDANPEGVPLRELGLDEDPKFLEMEERRRELLKDPVRNAGKIAALEKDMNDYVHELAKQKKADELGGIMSKDRGLASAPVDPEVLLNDPEFASLEAKWRELMKDPKKNAREIAAIEEKMRERARELAEEEKWKDREEYLDANPEGVPLRELGLDEDPKFLEMEERRRELLKDPVRNAGKIAALEKDMNDYVHELAKQKLADDRKNFLPSHISGVPLEDIPLDDDSLFRDMERERARLIAEDPVRNARKIQDLEKKMNARAQELAEAQKWKDREEYLDANPEGVPLRELGLDEDPKFLEMEGRRRELLKDPVRNAGKIAALEKDMNDYVHELAKQKLADDRKNFLPSHISGVPLEDIPLDDDSLFRDMERERARLIAEDPVRNARKIQDLEKKMNARAQELAEAQKWKDREEYLDANPEGVPLRELGLDEDPKFLEMEERRRELLKDPVRNAGKIAALEKDMNDYVHELAKQKLAGDRKNFLPSQVGGVDLRDVPVDEDPEFLRLDSERNRLIRSGADRVSIRAVEDAMNKRVKELAGAVKASERSFLDQFPEGVPLSLLDLDNDKEFLRLERARKALIDEDPVANRHRIASLEDAMNNRVHELALELKRRERMFLDPNPEGVPIDLLDLDNDPVFANYEDRLRSLMNNPTHNAKAIADLQREMSDYVRNVARKKKWDDRLGFLDNFPEGVDVRQLPLDDDEVFRRLEAERYRLILDDPVKNANRIAALELQMNKRAHELAKQLLKDQVHSDGRAARDISGQPSTADVLNAARAALARDLSSAEHKKAVDQLSKILRPDSYGLPLDFIPVTDDADTMNLLKSYVKLSSNPRKADEAEVVRHKLQGRVDALAYDALFGDRDAFLEPTADGLQTHDVPVQNDPLFRELALRRALLKTEPVANRAEMEDIEGALSDRARDLAGKWNDRLAYLDREPEGVALLDVPLDDDQYFTEGEEYLHNLLRNNASAEEINAQRDALNERCQDLARGVADDDLLYLQPSYNSIPTEQLNLHAHDEFSDLANAHRRERREGRRPLVHAEELLGNMDAFAKNVSSHTKAQKFAFLEANPDGVPLDDLDLQNDRDFRDLQQKYDDLLEERTSRNDPRLRDLEAMMNARAQQLAKDKNRKAGLTALEDEYLGVPTGMLNIENDPEARRILEELGRAFHDPNASPERIQSLKDALDRRAEELAAQYLAGERASYVPANPRGVPVGDLDLDNDSTFLGMEHKLRELMKIDPNSEAVKDLKYRINEYVDARARDILHNERRKYLNPAPGGVPLDELDDILDNDPLFRELEAERYRLSKDPRNAKRVRELEEQLNKRALELARQYLDGKTNAASPVNDADPAADVWRRIGDIYPTGKDKPLVPENPQAADVVSAPGDLTYLAPFLAALSREPPLLQRLFGSRTHPVGNAPLNFNFFDPSSNPVNVEIDDRIPCGKDGKPLYTRSPTGEWWPLLVEKAYAKFVGGYPRMEDCTSHETLRDLTGRPVTHLPLDIKLSKEVHDCDYKRARFWQRVRESLEQGDVYMAVSNDAVPDGIHPKCHYAIYDVIETVQGSDDPADIVIKIHNCYVDEPFYDGPLHPNDPNWSENLSAICNFDPQSSEFLFLPQPVFLRNFSSIQHCHINCGDRLTVAGEWNDLSSGGNPKYTTFRKNPIYLLENKSNRPSTVLVEIRHSAPVFYDTNNVGVYHPSSLAVLRSEASVKLVAPLLTYNTHKFITKGLLSDAREASMEVELPANSTCYLVPYTKKKGSFGNFQVSVYPQGNPVGLTTLRPIDETHNCISTEVVVFPGSGEGSRIDFEVANRCDLHVLVHQDKVSDPSTQKRGNYLAEDELMMAAYENNNTLIATTGDATNAREHSVAFQANNAGRYTLLLGCPSRPVTGDCPCTISVYAAQAGGCSLPAHPEDDAQASRPRQRRTASSKTGVCFTNARYQ
ncbi:Calpain family cysteine protease, putative [Angomonas deanei]|uniref:Calpain family cysteine protease, putative n=1 Tax=Angomonas deanei TaxID=59799 RepID=A0A7G2C6K1_9TRYP|nr:Calpain family cysteine protease, putative [Angomonas deanei]